MEAGIISKTSMKQKKSNKKLYRINRADFFNHTWPEDSLVDHGSLTCIVRLTDEEMKSYPFAICPK